MSPRDRWARAAGRVAGVRHDLHLVAIDAIVVGLAYMAGLALRFDGAVPDRYWERYWPLVPALVLTHLGVNALCGLYAAVWRFASIVEATRVMAAAVASLLAVLAVNAVLGRPLPIGTVVLGAFTATGVIGLLRFQARFAAYRRQRDERAVVRRASQAVVVGAGAHGVNVARDLQATPRAGYVPVAFVDDDPRKQGRHLASLRVAGTVADLASVIAAHRAEVVMLAVAEPPGDLVRRVTAAADVAGVPVKVVPRAHERRGASALVFMRDVHIEDLLGRTQVATDLAAVGRLVAGRSVLITGAGGSIGSEITRQVWALHPGRLVLVDNDETHLHDLVAPMASGPVPVLADIRDAVRLGEVFAEHRPEVVFHAAAHKHVPLLEDHPGEAVKTNVFGTANVLDAAAAHGTRHLVLISTDKAVRPTSVMGATKYLSEQLLLAAAPAGAPWCAVRFGNVLGSRGSVIPTFARQIEAGGPVTVTHPDMTRYFMSIPEAVQLVLQSAVFAEGGEVFMLEMGEPVNIAELAHKMIRLSGLRPGADIEVRYTGPRPGEKLTEELAAPAEAVHRTAHPGVCRLSPLRLPDSTLSFGTEVLAELMAAHDHARLGRTVVDLANLFTSGDDDGPYTDVAAAERLGQEARWNPAPT